MMKANQNTEDSLAPSRAFQKAKATWRKIEHQRKAVEDIRAYIDEDHR